MENWKTVTVNNAYEVSNLGRVRRIKSAPGCQVGHILKPILKHHGYLIVNLSFGSRTKRKACWIHRLVLESFIGPQPPGHETNHINGIKSDNHINNLEWITKSQNTLHAIYVLKRPWTAGARNGQAKTINAKKLQVLRAKGLTQAKAGKALGVSREVINRFENGHHWSQRQSS